MLSRSSLPLNKRFLELRKDRNVLFNCHVSCAVRAHTKVACKHRSWHRPVHVNQNGHNLWPFCRKPHSFHRLLRHCPLTCYTHTPKSLQCLRLTAIPNQNARHDPCPGTDLAKPLSPLETLALTSLWPNYHGSIRFWSNPIGTPISNGPFFVGTVDAHKQKNAEVECPYVPSLYTAGWVLIKEKNEVQNEVKTRYGKNPASTHMDFGLQAANLPFLGSLVAKQWQFAESQHTAMAV